MTKEDAIKILEEIYDVYDGSHELTLEKYYFDRMEAISMAIEVLKEKKNEEEAET